MTKYEWLILDESFHFIQSDLKAMRRSKWLIRLSSNNKWTSVEAWEKIRLPSVEKKIFV